MNRDPTRIVAWVLVGLGVLVIVLTKFVVDANYDAVLTYWSQHPVSLRRPAEPSYLGGWLTGAILAGFGVLLLAIRRPKPQSDPRRKR